MSTSHNNQAPDDAKAESDSLPQASNPANRALVEVGVTRASQLASFSEQELLAIHGIGPKAIRLWREAGVRFRGDKRAM